MTDVYEMDDLDVTDNSDNFKTIKVEEDLSVISTGKHNLPYS